MRPARTLPLWAWLLPAALLVPVALADSADARQAAAKPLLWMSEKYGKNAFLDGFLSVDADELRRFVPTGRPSDRLIFGPMEIITRTGIYLGNEAEEESDFDQPASVQVRFNNRLMAAAKGYRIGSDFEQFNVYIENWNGQKGCAVHRWNLKFVGERLLLEGEYWWHTETEEVCVRGASRQSPQPR